MRLKIISFENLPAYKILVFHSDDLILPYSWFEDIGLEEQFNAVFIPANLIGHS